MVALGMAALAAEVREEVLELAISNHHHTSALLRAYPRFFRRKPRRLKFGDMDFRVPLSGD
jgi:hypothetical protein